MNNDDRYVVAAMFGVLVTILSMLLNPDQREEAASEAALTLDLVEDWTGGRVKIN